MASNSGCCAACCSEQWSSFTSSCRACSCTGCWYSDGAGGAREGGAGGAARGGGAGGAARGGGAGAAARGATGRGRCVVGFLYSSM